MKNKGKVCIIDDDQAVCESLRMLLFAHGYSAVTHESADAFLADKKPLEAEVLLLDMRMPGTDGMQLQQILNRRGSNVPIIFITGHGDIPMAVNAMQCGAHDFLTKPFVEGELLAKIESAIHVYRKRRDEHRRMAGIRDAFDSLTPREREVLELVVKGRSNKQIADHLGISPRTVEIHRAHVMEKTRAGSVADLVRMQTELGVKQSD